MAFVPLTNYWILLVFLVGMELMKVTISDH